MMAIDLLGYPFQEVLADTCGKEVLADTALVLKIKTTIKTKSKSICIYIYIYNHIYIHIYIHIYDDT